MGVKRFPYGGQAVLEGVMMRGLHQATIAVRDPQGKIVFKHEPLNVARRRMWENMPFLRGILMLWDALNLGTRALNFSASVAIGEEEQPPSSLATTGAPLTVDSVRRFTLIHPRCGTSFLLVVFIVSFIVFMFVRGLPFWARLLSHIPLIPVIAGVTYELLRLSAANYHRAWVRALVA